MAKRKTRGAGVETSDLLTTPGITLRRYRGMEDLSEMARVMTLSREADGVDFVTTEADLIAQFSNPLDFDPGTDILVAEANDKMIGLARVWRKDREDGKRVYGHSVELLQEWRGRGIREELFRYDEKHIRGIAKEEGRERNAVFELWANSSDNEWKSIVESNGYQPVQHELDLVRSLDEIPEMPIPTGFEIRPVRPEHYEAIREANKDAWKDDWNFSEGDWDEEHFEAFKKRSSFQPELWQVAWKGDILAGMVLNYIIDEENQELGTKRGHTEDVYVREDFRGLGLARALLARSFKVLKDRGMDEATLSADDDPKGALRLYKGMGFRIVTHFTWYQKPLV